MPVPKPTKHPLRTCGCGCNREVTRWTERLHKKNPPTHPITQLESPPPPKRRRIAHFQAPQESFITRPGKQKQFRADNNSSPSHSRADASSSSSDHPQLHAPSFNPSLPLLDPPPASNLLQLPEDAPAEASRPSVDDILLNLHARTHRTTDQSDDEDSEGALEGDAVEAANFIDHETDDLRNGEDVAMESYVDPCEGIVSDWDLLTEEFIVEAEELCKFEHFFFAYVVTHWLFLLGKS